MILHILSYFTNENITQILKENKENISLIGHLNPNKSIVHMEYLDICIFYPTTLSPFLPLSNNLIRLNVNLLSKSITFPLLQHRELKKHPTIIQMKEVINLDRMFPFNFIVFDIMVNKINNLDLTTSDPQTSIPTKIVVGNSDIFAPILYNNFHNNIANCVFSSKLKTARKKKGY